MAIAIVGTPTTTQQAAANTIVVTYPAGIASTHVAYAAFMGTFGKTITGSKTWSQLVSSATQAGFGYYLLRRVLDGTEGASETFTITSTFTVSQAEMRVYSGVNNATPEDTAAANPQNAVGGGGTSPSLAGFTTNQDGDEIIYFALTSSGAPTMSTPSGFGNTKVSQDATHTQTVGGWDEAQATHGAIGTVSTTISPTGSGWGNILVAAQPAAVGSLPLPVFGHRYHMRLPTPKVRAKHRIRLRPLWTLPLSPHPDFPEQIRRRQQPKRVPRVKAKTFVRNRWITERQVTAPHADFPQQLRRQQQPHRVPRVKAKQRVRNRLLDERLVAIPSFPVNLFHRQQLKRVPKLKAKRVVKSSIELRIPRAPPSAALPLSFFTHKQKKRITAIKLKGGRRWRVLQVPQPQLALPRSRRILVRKRSIVRRRLTNNAEIRLPPQPTAKLSLPLPLAFRHRQRKRLLFMGKRSSLMMLLGRAAAIVVVTTGDIARWRFQRRNIGVQGRVRSSKTHGDI